MSNTTAASAAAALSMSPAGWAGVVLGMVFLVAVCACVLVMTSRMQGDAVRIQRIPTTEAILVECPSSMEVGDSIILKVRDNQSQHIIVNIVHAMCVATSTFRLDPIHDTILDALLAAAGSEGVVGVSPLAFTAEHMRPPPDVNVELYTNVIEAIRSDVVRRVIVALHAYLMLALGIDDIVELICDHLGDDEILEFARINKN